MTDLTIQASAPGKLILIGEYAVLENAPCIVTAVNRSCQVQIEAVEGDVFSIKASNQDIPEIEFSIKDGNINFINPVSDKNRERLRFVLWTLDYITEHYGSELKTASIYIDSDSFYHKKSGSKLGLGASASITVSLLSALSEFLGRPLKEKELYREAFKIHRKAQGKLGSGADIAASSVGGVLKYRMDENGIINGRIDSVTWPDDLIMIPVWAGYSASTQDLVRKVEMYSANNPSAYRAIMDPLKKLSQDGVDAFCSGNTDAFLQIVDDFIALEQKLGEASGTEIISKAHLKIKSVVKNAGGVYKPSGAGSGDIGVAFCNNPDTAQQVRHSIESSGFDILNLSPKDNFPAVLEQHIEVHS